MKLIVAVNENFGIGKGNKLLYSIPEDMAFFRETTQGKVIIMGHGTLKSFPGGVPLKNRINIVLTRSETLRINGAITCSSLAKLTAVLDMCATDDLYVIGGQSVYSLLLDYCGEALVTKIYAHADADSYFTNIDKLENWTLCEQSEMKAHEGLSYRFCRYKNNAVKALLEDSIF